MENFKNNRIFVYPCMDEITATKNEYINDFCENLEKKNNVIVNKNTKGNHLFPLVFHINDAEIFIFHWLENTPTYKYGFFQYIYSIITLTILKLYKKKIVWFCHNKKVHGLKNKIEEIQSNHLIRLLKKKANYIFTHSKEGLYMLDEYKCKSFFLMHPIKNRLHKYKYIKEYDLIIWGTISEYKGILEFLKYIKSNHKMQDLKIKIIGNCLDENLCDKIKKTISKNINFENRPVSFEELIILRSKVKFVLITHRTETILGSATLMDSLSIGFSVIAPDIAVFKELKVDDRINVLTYLKFDDIPFLLSKQTKKLNYYSFIEEYNWFTFTNKMLKIITK
jgi:beta-1,4-mannosyltransferase